jgi:hypothetical protein
MGVTREPERPKNISPHALACLEALARTGLGRYVSLGGAFALAHYVEYRETKDVDAWWSDDAGPEDRERVLGAVEATLRPFGEVRRRAWGEVASVDLAVEGRTIFEFQVARRSARLATPHRSSWPPIALDALDDLLASKMVALVERGAPRDFRDLFTVCDRGLADPERCWVLWETRQRLAREDDDRRRAALAVRTHLARLELARPIDAIMGHGEREAARRVRAWFAEEVLRGLPD